MLAETMKKCFGIQLKPLTKSTYSKPYPNWIEKMKPLQMSFIIPNFTTFSCEGDKSMVEHISRFIFQYGEENQNEYHKLQLFPLSLTRNTFT